MRVVNAAKQIKPKDFLAPFIFLIMLVPSFVFRLINKIKHRKLWLVAEQGEARDNGYHFYKYVREKHPEDFCFYAVKINSAGYKKVAKLGNVVKYGGLKHWLYYMSANLNISSQKSGNPCPIFWYFIHVTLGLYRNRVFLQHGVTKDDARCFYYTKTKFKNFVTSVKPEYDFIIKKYGYPKGAILLTGLPRWDNFEDTSKVQKQKSILIAPTWRNWLGGTRNRLFKIANFEDTEFYKNWNSLLVNEQFKDFIEKNNIKVYFLPHIAMKDFLGSFKVKTKNIEIVSPDNDIQKYLSKCDLMVTDYSSVGFDFAYLDKPVIYYQFDKSDYREKQLQNGYFSYEKDGFGPIADTDQGVTKEIIKYFNFGISEKYFKNIKKIFPTKITNCSSALYDVLLGRERANDLSSKVSIVVPAYNTGRQISRCLSSLIGQSYTNIEIIVVDDGSQDKTLDIVNKFAKRDARIKVLKRSHCGPNLARKYGVKMATGKYTMFVDSDDYISKSAVLELVKQFEKNNVDVIRFGAIKLPEDTIFAPIIASDRNKVLSGKDIMRLMLTSGVLNNLCFQIYKTDMLKNIVAFDSKIKFGEDFLANLEIHQKTKRVLFYDKTLYYYCNNPKSTSRNKDRKEVINTIKDRIFITREAINLSNSYGKAIENAAIYYQIKSMRYRITEIANIPNYNEEKFLNDFEKTLPSNWVTGVNYTELDEFMRKLSVVEKLKNRRIVKAILTSDYKYIWKYVHLYKTLRGLK